MLNQFQLGNQNANDSKLFEKIKQNSHKPNRKISKSKEDVLLEQEKKEDE